MTVDVLMPHAVIRVRFLTTDEGGRKTAIRVKDGTQDVKYGCPVFVNGQAFDCRFWPFAAGGYELGEEYDIPIRFLSPKLAMESVSPGAAITLWEGKTIAVGQVLTTTSHPLPTPHGPPLPTFDRAMEDFGLFLSKCGLSSQANWLFENDVIEWASQTYVRSPHRNDHALVKRLYEQGVRRGLGINLHAFCLIDGNPGCYLWLPKDEVDAEYRMVAGLKFSAATNLAQSPAISVASWIQWSLLRWRKAIDRRHRTHEPLPSARLR